MPTSLPIELRYPRFPLRRRHRCLVDSGNRMMRMRGMRGVQIRLRWVHLWLGRGSVCKLMLQSRMEFVLPREGMQWQRVYKPRGAPVVEVVKRIQWRKEERGENGRLAQGQEAVDLTQFPQRARLLRAVLPPRHPPTMAPSCEGFWSERGEPWGR